MKLVNDIQLDADLTAVANAIRVKGSTDHGLIFPSQFISAIEALPEPKEEQTKTINISQNGTTTIYPDTGKVLSGATVNVNVQGGGGVPLPSTITAGDTPVLVNANSYTCVMTNEDEQNLHATGLVITISKAGTYRFKWCASQQTGGTSITDGSTGLYKNEDPVGSLHSFSFNDTSTASFSEDIACNAGDSVEVWIAAGTWTFGFLGTYSGGGAYGFCACIDWNNTF